MLNVSNYESEDNFLDSTENQAKVDYSEICIIGRDLVDFNVTRFGAFIKKVDLSFNFLKRIDGLNVCSETLEELILDNNQLERLELGAVFPKLHTVSLNKNRVWHICSIIKELKNYTNNLRFLSLLGNPICPDQLTNDSIDDSDYPTYRCHILHHLNCLRFLDHRQVTSQEINEARKLIYSTIKLSSTYTPLPSTTRISRTLSQATSSISDGSQNSSPAVQILVSNTPRKVLIPNPNTSSETPNRQTIILKPRTKLGKKSIKYIGKNSEGNRFIKDTDL